MINLQFQGLNRQQSQRMANAIQQQDPQCQQQVLKLQSRPQIQKLNKSNNVLKAAAQGVRASIKEQQERQMKADQMYQEFTEGLRTSIIDGIHNKIQVEEPYYNAETGQYNCIVKFPPEYQIDALRQVKTLMDIQNNNLSEQSLFVEGEPQDLWDSTTQYMKSEIIALLVGQAQEAVQANLADLSQDTKIKIKDVHLEEEESEEKIMELQESFNINETFQITAYFDPSFAIQKENPLGKFEMEVPVITDRTVLSTQLTQLFRERFGVDETKDEDEILQIGDKVNLKLIESDYNGLKQEMLLQVDTLDPYTIDLIDHLIGCQKGDTIRLPDGFRLYKDRNSEQYVITYTNDNPEKINMEVEVLEVVEVKIPLASDDMVKDTYDLHKCQSVAELQYKYYNEEGPNISYKTQQTIYSALTMFNHRLLSYYDVKLSEAELYTHVQARFINILNSHEALDNFVEKYCSGDGIGASELRKMLRKGETEILDKYLPEFQDDASIELMPKLLGKLAWEKFIKSNIDILSPPQEEIDNHLKKQFDEEVRKMVLKQEKKGKHITNQDLLGIRKKAEYKAQNSMEHQYWILMHRYDRLKEHSMLKEIPELTMFEWEFRLRQFYNEVIVDDLNDSLVKEKDVKEAYRRAQESDYKQKLYEEHLKISLEEQQQPKQENGQQGQTQPIDVEFREKKNKGFGSYDEVKEKPRGFGKFGESKEPKSATLASSDEERQQKPNKRGGKRGKGKKK